MIANAVRGAGAETMNRRIDGEMLTRA